MKISETVFTCGIVSVGSVLGYRAGSGTNVVVVSIEQLAYSDLELRVCVHHGWNHLLL
jgi:hypothetical protein